MASTDIETNGKLFIEYAKEKHNNFYDYSRVIYRGCKEKIEIVCPIHGSFWQTPDAHKQGRGCQKCGIKRRARAQTFSNEQIDKLLISRKIKRLEDYKNANTNLLVECLVDNCRFIWQAKTGNLINNNKGCPKCAGNLALNNDIVDDRLNGRPIKRLDNFITVMTPINFQCLNPNCNIIWKASPDNIFHGRGCPKCNRRHNEDIIDTILVENDIVFERNKKLVKINREYPNYVVDFYFAKCRLIIEYNGEQHYGPVRFGGRSLTAANKAFIKQQSRDKELNDFCMKNGFEIIWIDGRKYHNNNLQNYIYDILLQYIKSKLL